MNEKIYVNKATWELFKRYCLLIYGANPDVLEEFEEKIFPNTLSNENKKEVEK